MKKMSKLTCAKWILLAVFIVFSALPFLFACAPETIGETRVVRFMNGEEVVEEQIVPLGEKYSFPDEIPTREQPDDEHMCKFLGWTLDPNFYEYRSEILEEPDYVVGDLTIYAAFRTVLISDTEGGGADLEYNVEFRMPRGDDFGEFSGKVISKQIVKRYGSAVLPSDEELPEITGYHFTGKWEGGTLQDVRGHRRVTAVYEKNVYNYVWHYLGETSSKEVEFRDPIDLNEKPETEPAFVFEGWYTDPGLTIPAKLTEAPAGNIELYAKYSIDFSTATVSKEGRMVYGDDSNKFYVSGLNLVDGLDYTFVWTVNGQIKDETSSGYPVKNAGLYTVGVHILANYKDGVLTDEGDALDSNNSAKFEFTLEKAPLTAAITLDKYSLVYGQPAPAVNGIEYSGFVFDETLDDVDIEPSYKYMQDGVDRTDGRLHAGVYEVVVSSNEIGNYRLVQESIPEFTVTKKDLHVSLSVDDYTYGTGFAPDIDFSGFEYNDGEDVLGEHWFALDNQTRTRAISADNKYTEGDIIHAGNHVVELLGYDSNDYEIYLPDNASFHIAKRMASAELVTEDGVYGELPKVSFILDNVLEQDKERFSATYSYTRGGNSYKDQTRFIVGSYMVAAEFYEDGSDYEPIPVASATFNIGKADLHVGVAVNDKYTYGDKIEPEVSFTQSDFFFGEDEGVLYGRSKFVYRKAAAPDEEYNGHFTVDSYTVEAAGYSADNYNIIYTKAPFEVAKKLLTLTVCLENNSIRYGSRPQYSNGDNVFNGISYDGFITGETVRIVFGELPVVHYYKGTADGDEILISETFHAGSYVATTSAEAQNYEIKVVPVNLTVEKRTLYVGINLNSETLEYGKKPTAEIVYEKEGYDGFYGTEKSTYVSGAAIFYDGATDYYQSELNSPSTKMVAGRYALSVKNISEDINIDYEVTYQHVDGHVGFEITPKTLVATIEKDKDVYTYGDKPVLTVSFVGWAYSENVSELFESDGSHIFIGGSDYTPAVLGAGQYTATLAESLNTNYEIEVEGASFTVNKKALTVKASVEDFIYGNDPEPQISYDGFIEGEDQTNALIGTLGYSYTGELSSSNHYRAGSHTLSLSGYESENYEINYESATFTVSPIEVTLTTQSGWSVYAEDRKNAEGLGNVADGYWYAVSDNIIGDELTFSLSITHDGEEYIHGADIYYPIGEYKVSVNFAVNNDYAVKHNGETVESGSVQTDFTVAQASASVNLNASHKWAKRRDWSFNPQDVVDNRFTFSGTIVLNNPEDTAADSYTETQINKTFKWSEEPVIKLAGSDTVVTDNFKFVYTLNLTLDESDFNISKPSVTEFTYDKQPHEFTVSATADDVPTEQIEILYKTDEHAEYGKTAPQFTAAGDYTVYFKVSAPNCTDKEDSFTVTGNRAQLNVTHDAVEAEYNAQNHFATIKAENVTGLCDGDSFTVTYGKSAEDCTQNSLTLVNVADSGEVYYKVAAGDNYNEATGSYKITINKANLTVTKPLDVETEYNTEDHFAKVEEVEGVSGDSSFDFTVTYGKSEEDCTQNSLTFVKVADSGEVYYRVTAGGNYNEATGFYAITINKAVVEVPEIAHTPYNKETQTATVAESELYKVTTNDGGVAAGDYNVVLTLSDSANYKWSGETEAAEITLTFTIDKAQLEKPTAVEGQTFTYNGGEQEFKLDGVDLETMSVDGNKQTNANESGYTVTVSLSDTANYEWSGESKEDPTFNFKIAKATPELQKSSGSDTYSPAGGLLTDGQIRNDILNNVYGDAKIDFEISRGNIPVNELEEIKDTGEYTLKITVTGDNYNEITLTYTFTVDKAKLEKPTAVEGQDFTYNGGEQEFKLDGVDLATMSVVGNKQKDANESGYTVTVSLSDTANYEWSGESKENPTFTFKIAKADLTVTLPTELEYTYDGDNHFQYVKIGEAQGEDNISVQYSTIGQNDSWGKPWEIIDVNSNKHIYYNIYAVLGSLDNYALKSASGEDVSATGDYTLTSKQAPLSLGEVVGISGLTYNGGDQYAENNDNIYKAITGMVKDETAQDDAISKIEYTQIECINADKYTVNFTLTASDNYKFKGENKGSYTITIDKATLTRPTEDKTEFTYNGGLQTYEPQIADDVKDHVTVKNNTRTDAGTQEVVVSINESDKTNYEWVGGTQADVEFTFTINRKALTKPTAVDGQTFTYNGKEQEFKLNNFELATMTIEGNKRTNAEGGRATQVVVKLRDTQNYKWSDGSDGNLSFDFIIARATRNVDNLPEIPEQVKKLGVREKLSQVDFGRFGLPDGMRWVNAETPLKVGTYDYDVVIDEDENYSSYNGKISITVLKQKVTVQLNNVAGIEVDFSGTTVDFDTLKSKFLAESIDYNLLNEEGHELTSAELALFPELTNPTISCNGTIDKGGTYLITYSFNFTENDYFIGDGTAIEGYTYLKVKSVEVGGTLYTIEDALAVANGTITVKYNTAFATLQVAELAGYSEAGGNYTVRTGVTLLLPYDGATGVNTTNTAKASSYGKSKKLELIIPDDITLLNQGTISIGGITTGQQGFAGGTAGDYAQITLGKNAIIDSYGDINAYGFIDESSDNNGSQVIMNNGTLLMPFIVVEHRGGSVFYGCYKDLKGSPFNSFYLQNVISELTIKHDALLSGHANLYAGSQDNVTDIKLAGKDSNALINLSDSSSKLVAKYNKSNSVIDLHVYGNFKLNSMNLSVSLSILKADLSTAKVLFPVSWHFNISLHRFENGNNAIVDATSQSIKIMPGASLRIDKGVTVNAKDIIVYDNDYIAKAVGAGDLYQNVAPKENGVMIPGKVILDGNLNVQNIGGKIDSSEDGAVLTVNGDTSITSYELLSTKGSSFTATVEWETYVKSLSLSGIGSPTKGSYVFIGSDTIWQQATKTISFTIRYHIDSKVEEVKYTVPVIEDTYSLAYADKESPEKQYYTFNGWYLDELNSQSLGSNPQVVSDGTVVELYAGWEKAIYDIVYIVDFAGEDSAYINKNAATWSVGDVISLGDASHANKDLQFKGWFSDPSYEKQVTEVSGSNISELLHKGIIVIFGYFENANKAYDVVFDAAGITGYNNLPATPEGITVKIGGTLGENFPTGDFTVNDNDVTKQYYFGGGWTANGKEITKDTPVDASYLTDGKLVVTAVWNEKVVLSVQAGANGTGGLFGFGAAAYTATATIIIDGKSYGEVTVTGDKNSTTKYSDPKTFYLKPGQSYQITATEGKINGGESVKGSAEAGKNITITVENIK